MILTSDNLDKFLKEPKMDIGIGERYCFTKLPTTWGNVFIKREIFNPMADISFEIPDYVVYKKIPINILLQLQDFFKEVYDEYKSEVFAFIVKHRKTDEYKVVVPKQTVSSAHVSYETEIDNDYQLIANVHSHHTMGAFFSGTDDDDDKNNTSLSIVMANLDDILPEMVIRTWAYDKFIDVSPLDVFDFKPYMLYKEIEDIISVTLNSVYNKVINMAKFCKVDDNTFKEILKDVKLEYELDYRRMVDIHKIFNIKFDKLVYDKNAIKKDFKVFGIKQKPYNYGYNYDDYLLEDDIPPVPVKRNKKKEKIWRW